MEKINKGLVKVVGKVSGLHSSVHSSGSIRTGALSGNVSGNITSADQFAFRIDNTPVTFKYEGGVSIREGDVVIIVGRMKKGQIEGYALKNISTGAYYDHYNSLIHIVLWAGMLPLSIGMIALLVGIILTPITVYLIYQYHALKYAARIVESYAH